MTPTRPRSPRAIGDCSPIKEYTHGLRRLRRLGRHDVRAAARGSRRAASAVHQCPRRSTARSTRSAYSVYRRAPASSPRGHVHRTAASVVLTDRRKGPNRAENAATGKPVCTSSNHFSTSSPWTVGGSPNRACRSRGPACTSAIHRPVLHHQLKRHWRPIVRIKPISLQEPPVGVAERIFIQFASDHH